MGESVRDILNYLCRLCARTDRFCVNVFSSDGDKHFIQKKIRLCLPVIIEEKDEMPTQICLSCLNKLDATYEFYTTSISAQSTIQRLLRAETPHECDRVNKSSSEINDKIPGSFSLDHFLKRKIGPIDTEKSCKVQRNDQLEKNLTSNKTSVENTENSTPTCMSGVSVKSSVMAPDNSEIQCASTAGGSSNSSVLATDNLEFQSATLAEPQKPKLRVRTTREVIQTRQTGKGKLRVKTTSELRQAGQADVVTDCASALLSLQGSSAQPVSALTTSLSSCVNVSHSTNVVYSQAAGPQSSCNSSLPQRAMNSSVPQTGASSSSGAQNGKSISSVIQFGKSSSSASVRVRGSPSVPLFGTSSSVVQLSTSSSSALQNTTSSVCATNNATVSLPVSMNATVPLPVKNNATSSLPVPQNAGSSSSAQQYAFPVASSPSSALTILPNGSQFIIMPTSFTSTQTSTATGTRTVTVLAPAVPSNVSVAGDLRVPLGQASSLVAPQSVQATLPVSVEAVAVPLTSSSLPLVQSVPPHAAQPPQNPVVTSLTTAPASISQSNTAAVATYSVLNRNRQALAISSNSGATGTTSTANAFSRAEVRPMLRPENSKVSSSSSVGAAASVRRVVAGGTNSKLRTDTVAQGITNAPSTVVPQNNSAQLRTNSNIVPVPISVSYPNVIPKLTSSELISLKNITNNLAPFLLTSWTPSVLHRAKRPLAKYGKTSKTESTPKRKALFDDGSQGSSSHHSDTNKNIPTFTVSCYSDQLASEVNSLPPDRTDAVVPTAVSSSQVTVPTLISSSQVTVPTGVTSSQVTVCAPISSSQSTVSTAQHMSSGSVGSAKQLKQGDRNIIIKRTYVNEKSKKGIHESSNGSNANTEMPISSAESGARTESQLSEKKPEQKVSVARPQPSRVLPPPPPAVPLKTVSSPENGRIVANCNGAYLQNGEALSTSGQQVSGANSQKQSVKNVVHVPQKSYISSQAHKLGLTPKPRGAVVTASVSPFSATGSESEVQPSAGPSSEVQAEPGITSPSSPPPAEPGRPSSSSLPATVGKEECPHCHVAFPVDILMHHKTLHYRERFYTCIDCDKNFVTEKGLESHRCQKERQQGIN